MPVILLNPRRTVRPAIRLLALLRTRRRHPGFIQCRHLAIAHGKQPFHLRPSDSEFRKLLEQRANGAGRGKVASDLVVYPAQQSAAPFEAEPLLLHRLRHPLRPRFRGLARHHVMLLSDADVVNRAGTTVQPVVVLNVPNPTRNRGYR